MKTTITQITADRGRNPGQGQYIGHRTRSGVVASERYETGADRPAGRDGAYEFGSQEVEVGSWALVEFEGRHPNGCGYRELRLEVSPGGEPDWSKIEGVVRGWAEDRHHYPRVKNEEVSYPTRPWSDEEALAWVQAAGWDDLEVIPQDQRNITQLHSKGSWCSSARKYQLGYSGGKMLLCFCNGSIKEAILPSEIWERIQAWKQACNEVWAQAQAELEEQTFGDWVRQKIAQLRSEGWCRV